MSSGASLRVRLFVIAGLLIQLAGSLPLGGAAAEAAAQPARQARTVSGGEADMLGYFAAGAEGEAVSAAAGAAAEPLPRAEAPSEPPPPLPDAGPYYEAAHVDPITEQVATDVGGTIVTDTTWTLAGSPYTATSSVTVGPTATLTIEPGVVVKYVQGASMLVTGRLLAQGTPGAGITFAGTSAQAGWWGGLSFEGPLGNPLTGSQLSYVTVADGGYYASRPANVYVYAAEVTVAHATIANGKYSGVYGGAQGVAHLSDTTLSGNGNATADPDFAIWFTDGSAAPNLANLTMTGNSQDAIAFGNGTLTTRTWKALGYPYVLTGSQTVPVGAVLTVEPGVQARFQQGTTLLINGQLQAVGTSGAGISFAGTSAQPGWWSGLSFEGTLGSPLTGSQLAHVTIADGGYYASHPGNIYLLHAAVDLAHGQISNGKYSGVYGAENGQAHIADTTLSGNGNATADEDYAIWFTQGSVAPSLANLTMSGNSQNAVAFGGGTLTSRTWNFTGYPYILTGSQVVPYGATLTVEPGVMVRSNGSHQILVSGRLQAVGEPTAPITFTAMTATPGAWKGLAFNGQTAKLAAGVLDYVTVEYGGDCGTCANVSTYFAQVSIAHSKLRSSSTAGLRAATNSAVGLVVENSQFTGNATYGVQNLDPQGSVLAANNWWGHPSGPSTPGNNCNIGGTGQAITNGVAFLPFLTSASEQPNEVSASQTMSLSLNPRRYFAPADGTTRVWFEITLRDGAGIPIVGQVVRLRTNLGTPVDGGTTDASGRVFAFLTSNTVGEAAVFAELDQLTACEFLRSATTDITFNAVPDDPLSPDAQSPYSNAGVEFDPQPVLVGVPGVLRVRLHNPNNFAITVDATFSFAQLGLGLIFGPVGDVNGFVIQPQSDGVLELPWVPLVSGHFCIRVDYTWTPVGGAAGAGEGGGSGSTGSNTGGAPAPMLRPFDKNAIRRASVATTSLGDISFAAAGLDDIVATGSPAASAPVGFLQGLMIGNILDFIFEGGGGIDCAMDGGTSCGGWQGPRMHFPGESFGNLASDPPSPDYRTLVPLEILTFPPLAPSATIPPARAAAINELVRAGLDLTSYLTAAAATYDRYAGAVEADEFGWATQQANAFSHYLRQAALQMDVVADKMDALVAQLHAEDLKFLLAEQDFSDYQQRLATEGFNAQEIEAARMVGKTDEGIALSLQRRLALDPAEVSGWFDVRMTEAAQAFRELSFALTNVPLFGSVGSPGLAEGEPADTNLMRMGEPAFDFQVGNPFTVETTIDLKVRRIDLPADWIINLSADALTLAPGEQITVTATAVAGLPGVQGTLPRFAVEGYANGDLLGGVEFQVYLPVEQPFYGADRVYLPVLTR